MELEYENILRCPNCKCELNTNKDGLRCNSCEITYPTTEGQIDFRIQESVSKNINFEFNGDYLNPDDFNFQFDKNTNTEVDFSNTKIPHHLDEEILSHFPKADSQQEYALDAGCGDGIHRQVCENAGFDWVGIDIHSEEAPLLGDVQALPFDDSTFEFCISIAVLEHVSNPFVFLNEIRRVLKTGSKFIGTVAFLEPFHGNSHYHHSPLGTIHALQQAGFIIKQIGPTWHSLTALGWRLFPKLPRKVLSAGTVPIYFAHQIWYSIGRMFYNKYESSKEYQKIGLAGAFKFVAIN